MRKKRRNRWRIAIIVLASILVTIVAQAGDLGSEPDESFPQETKCLIQDGMVDTTRIITKKVFEQGLPAMKEEEWRYQPTEEEFLYACKLAFAEAGLEEPIGQTAVIEVALNAVEAGYASNIIEEFVRYGRYSSVKDGVPQVPGLDGKYRPVRESDLSDELKEAVRKAFKGERVTEKYLKEQAFLQGLTDESYWRGGALYFFNWELISEKAKQERNQEAMPVRVKIGNHTFARYWQ